MTMTCARDKQFGQWYSIIAFALIGIGLVAIVICLVTDQNNWLIAGYVGLGVGFFFLVLGVCSWCAHLANNEMKSRKKIVLLKLMKV